MLPSLKLPVALNCCWFPSEIVGFIGVTLIEVRPGGEPLPELLADFEHPLNDIMAVTIAPAIQTRIR